MPRTDRPLLNGIVAAAVAAIVADAVGRDRRLALAAGLLSGSLTALSSWATTTPEPDAEPAG
jgi:hypothetical protein